jgi:glycosyltransferase involved in cell wall biosynthesis
LKKKILYHSNFSNILSGFGKNAKNILTYLYSTGKYEVVELSNGVTEGHNELDFLPWKAIGGLPSDPSVIDRINKDPNLNRSASYGALKIDDVIKREKPDIYIGVEDIWGVSGYSKKPWWNKINCMVWTTLDSLPILPEAVNCAKKIKNYYVWSSFAEKAMHEKGHTHVGTLHGCVDSSNFFKLDYEEKEKLRNKHKISEDDFVIGFVFRNQLRKSVSNLLDGFKIFKNKNPKSNAKLLLHTNWGEGWDIPRLIEEKQIDNKDILCTYYCSKCNQYEIKPFTGNKLDCPLCGSKKSVNTINIKNGVNEIQLNEIYNLMDVYCHPFTSGGQEIPIQEAKLTELVTLVTNYSCGEEGCSPESGGIALDWHEYREHGTQFIKASTSPHSIAKELSKVFKMDVLKKTSLGKKSREYVIKNYSIEAVGKKLESIIDSMPEIEYDFNFEKTKRNPNYTPPNIESNSDWLIDLYKNILMVDLDTTDEGHQYWMKTFESGGSRDGILDYFRKTAQKENEEIESTNVTEFGDIIQNKGNKKALFVLKEGYEDILLATTLFESFHKSNPGYDLFFACDQKYQNILFPNPHIYKIIPYDPKMENEALMITSVENKPYFDYYCNLGILTQRMSNYHGIENFALDIYE